MGEPGAQWAAGPVDSRHWLFGPDLPTRGGVAAAGVSGRASVLRAAVVTRGVPVGSGAGRSSAPIARPVALQRVEPVDPGGRGFARGLLAVAPTVAIPGDRGLACPGGGRRRRRRLAGRRRGGELTRVVPGVLADDRLSGSGAVHRAVPGPVDGLGEAARRGGTRGVLVAQPAGGRGAAVLRDLPTRSGDRRRPVHGSVHLRAEPDAD